MMARFREPSANGIGCESIRNGRIGCPQCSVLSVPHRHGRRPPRTLKGLPLNGKPERQ